MMLEMWNFHGRSFRQNHIDHEVLTKLTLRDVNLAQICYPDWHKNRNNFAFSLLA